ncbi:MAG: 1,4-alpha-glucan branching enzyme, partial [Gammaproteobacteria bacterium]|nr:1,4-alpha-glucan branching enzyme [Gammaproteobacteria bacterium]
MERTIPDVDRQRIIEARHHDPFAVLGRHGSNGKVSVRVFNPMAANIVIAEGPWELQRIDDNGLFEWQGKGDTLPERYSLIWRDYDNREHVSRDPYCFTPQLSDFDLHLFSEGKHWHAYRFLGAHVGEADGVAGVLFAVWAPNAERVSVVGDFNRWDGRSHPMRVRGASGVWELFIPDLGPGTLYKFELRNAKSGTIQVKSDPYGQYFESRPKTASIVTQTS